MNDLRKRVYDATLGRLKKSLSDNEGFVRQDPRTNVRTIHGKPGQALRAVDNFARNGSPAVSRAFDTASKVPLLSAFTNPARGYASNTSKFLFEPASLETPKYFVKSMGHGVSGVATIAGGAKLATQPLLTTGKQLLTGSGIGAGLGAALSPQDRLAGARQGASAYLNMAPTLALTTPVINAFSGRVASAFGGVAGGAQANIAGRTAAGLGNVAEGFELSRQLGRPIAEGAALDFGAGFVVGNTSAPNAKGLSKGDYIDARDMEIFDQAVEVIRNKKKYTLDQLQQAKDFVRHMGEGHLDAKMLPDNADVNMIIREIHKISKTVPSVDSGITLGIKGADDVADPLTQEARKYTNSDELIEAIGQRPYVSNLQNPGWYYKKNGVPERLPDDVGKMLNKEGFRFLKSNKVTKTSSNLYHTTKAQNLDSIAKEGLVTGKPPRFEGVSSSDKISFSANEKGAAYYGGADDVMIRTKRGFVPDDMDHDLLAGGQGYYRTGKNISPENLEVKVKGKWIPLEEYSNPLMSEARKYKSAEEFVNELSSTQSKSYKIWEDLQVKLNKSGKEYPTEKSIADAFPKEWKAMKDADISKNQILEAIQKSTGRFQLGFQGGEFDNASAKSQLTDIWNKANQPAMEVKGPMMGFAPTEGGSTGLRAQAPQNAPVGAGGSTSTLRLKGAETPPMTPALRIPDSSSRNTTLKTTTIQDVERQIYGSETGVDAKGLKTSVGFIGDNLRKLERGASNLVSRGLESENTVIRNVAGLMQDLSGGAGKSSDQIDARAQYRGGIDYGTKVASDAQRHVYTLLNNSEKSLARVHAVLDPQISKIKVLEKQLNPQEREALGTLRILSDFVNDTNYKNGFISQKQWSSNRGGKYIARAYEAFDYPPEVADFVKNKDVRFDLNPFKTRGEITDWKVENAIKDPAYLMSKRVQQTMFNGEVMKYTQWASKSGLTSDVAKPGFVQLSDSKAYGDMAGKWIRKDALEDVKGFFVTHDVGQKAYEILSWYDRNPIRRSQKMLKTVFNPAVRLGNRTGNYVFAWLNGINPISFTKNTLWANKAIKSNDPLYRYAVQNGLIGTDVTKADIARVSAELSREIQDPSLLKKVIAELQNSYGRVDDASKLASLKTWVDRGIDPAEAINRTRRGFQDYNMVGFLYDIGAKMPILGNPFVRFASESVRIAKNAAVDHPIRAIGTVGAWALFTDAMSRMQGETAQDKETREQRVGASHLPFTDISTNIQTQWGEVNVSRLLGFSTTFTPEGATYADISKYSPIQNPLDIRSYGSDPVVGPIVSLATDTDFRGKSIADPNQSRYTGSTLTQNEKNMNRLGFLGRAYLPPTATDLYNVKAATQGEPNVYGQEKSVKQAVARVYPGVKVEQFGPEEADAARKREAYFNTQKMERLETKAKAIQKDLETGKITKEQAKKRNTEVVKEMIPDPKFVNHEDAPEGMIDTLKLYLKAGGTDLPATLYALRTGQPIRKVENDIVVLKRMQNLGKLDFGDESTQIDHDVPLQYGGSNYDNLLPITDNKQKSIVQRKLYKELSEGKITQTEMNNRLENWREEVSSFTATEKKQATSLDFLSKEPTTAVAKARHEDKKYTEALKIYRDEDMDEKTRTTLLNTIGLDTNDLNYYDVATSENYIKSLHVREEISGLPDNDRQALLQKLAEMRRPVNRKFILADGVIKDLVSEGIITKAEGKALKSINFDGKGKLRVKMSGRGRGAKLKKVKFVPLSIKSAPIQNVSFEGLKTPSGMGQNRLRVPRLQVQNVKPRQQPKFQVRFDL